MIHWNKNLSTFQSYKKLKGYSSSSYDLRQLTSDRLEKFRLSKEGWTLFFGTQKIDDQIFGGLIELAKEAQVLEKMEAMQRGELLNTTEKRAVLHTAMRDLTTSLASKETALAKAEIDKMGLFLKEIGEDQFTDLVTIAIGGSDLGPRALYESLSYLRKKGRRAHFISNVDPDDAASVLRGLDLRKTLVAVISKSGTTLETLTNETLVRSYFEKQGVDPSEHFLAITQKGSPMDDPTKYRRCFYLYDFVGGRYSATAVPGGLLLSFAIGFDHYLDLLKGAEAMDLHARSAPYEENIPLLMALLGIWNRNFLNLPTVALIPYCQALSRFPAHVQQLDMESNGKHIDRQGERTSFETGPVIWGEPGTNAQHSFFQLIHQGTSIIPLEFLLFKDSQYGEDKTIEGSTSSQKLMANAVAQMIALAMGEKGENPLKECLGNRPSSLLFAQKLDPYRMGSLFALYEHKVAFQGFIWGINSFDQEGVQLGKKLAGRVLERISSLGFPFPQADAILKYLI